MSKKLLLPEQEIEIILQRLACQLVENHGNFNDTALIGIQPRGIPLLNRLVSILENDYHIKNLNIGQLDITFFRDDFRRRESPIAANKTSIDFIIENKNVVFIDDVLFSGRSIRAALSAIQSFGRPKNIELLVLIDRRFSRHLPIQPNYRGRQVDVINEEKVVVQWKENNKTDAVYITN
ncbi:MAG: bifunctional pyr operon transcriptional regulator/uracil phosphoribosyltransferase PyrR [Lutibacter sp.]